MENKPKKQFFKSKQKIARKCQSQTVKQKLERKQAKERFFNSPEGQAALKKIAAADSLSFRLAVTATATAASNKQAKESELGELTKSLADKFSVLSRKDKL